MKIERRLFAAPYDENTAYSAGDIVFLEGTQTYYVALTSVGIYTPPEWLNVTEWVRVPQWAELEESYDAPTWTRAETYAQYDQVLYHYTGKYYQAHTSPARGTQPSVTAFWGEIPLWRRHIDYQQDWQFDGIGDVFDVYSQDPRTLTNAPTVTWEGTSDGILIRDQVPWVWIRHRVDPPSMTSDPATLPARFGDYCALYAAGMMLRVDGKVEVGNQYLTLAAEELQSELNNAIRYEGDTRRITVYA
jgi:hypothetical protein